MKKGFTIIELLLVVVMISAAAGLMIPVFLSYQNKNDFDIVKEQYVSSLRRSQALAKANESDSNWGTSLSGGKITIYKGNNFASRDATFDEEFETSTQINFTGITEVNFSRISGTPNQTGNTIINGANGESSTVTINAKGIINY